MEMNIVLSVPLLRTGYNKEIQHTYSFTEYIYIYNKMYTSLSKVHFFRQDDHEINIFLLKTLIIFLLSMILSSLLS